MTVKPPTAKLDRILDDWFRDQGVDDADVRWLIDSLMNLRDVAMDVRKYTSKARVVPGSVAHKLGQAVDKATELDP